MKNGTATLIDSLAVSYKAKYTIQSSDCDYRHLLHLFENLGPHKYLHMNIYSSFIHKASKIECKQGILQ